MTRFSLLAELLAAVSIVCGGAVVIAAASLIGG